MDPQTVSTITAVSSALIALAAFLVAWWTGHVQRRHAELSVQPHLDFIYGNTSLGALALVLVNNGIGPAIVDSFSISVGDSTIKSPLHLGVWNKAFSKAGGDAPATANVPLIGQYLSPGERLFLVNAGDNVSMAASAKEATETAQRFESALLQVRVHIAYRSLYGVKHEATWVPNFGAEA